MVLSIPELPVPIRFEDLFGRAAPVEIEIGVGKGRFLRERAAAFPDRDFLGIEKSKKWLLHAEERLRKAQLQNIRLAVTYAEGFLERYIPDGSVSVYHVLFPDPWPKRRHAKRRIFNASFLQQIARTLRPDGELHVATDYADYFRQIMEELSASPDLAAEPTQPGPFLSNFQAKYLVEGRPLNFAVARVKPSRGTGESSTRSRTPSPPRTEAR
jgi:tRNA (guanine-N7-)-methyltransferase